MKAVLSNHRQAPRKVRLVADVLRGKTISEVEVILPSLVKKASLPLKKLVDSAVANAVNNFKADKSDLFIKEISVNKGVAMRRHKPGARGRAFPFRRISSHIVVVLGSKEGALSLPAKSVKVEKSVASGPSTKTKKASAKTAVKKSVVRKPKIAKKETK